MNQDTICIIGNGAIGSLAAATASQSGLSVYRAIRGEGPAVSEVIDGTQKSLAIPDTILRLDDPAPSFDLVIVPLKVYQLKDALRAWLPLISNSPVLLLQNGMGGEAIAASCLNGQRLYQATTSHGALKENTTTVRHTGAGQTVAGRAPSTPVNKVIDARVQYLIEQAFPPVIWSENIRLPLWQKLSVNLVINPLTAIHNITNGSLLDSCFDVQLYQLCIETAAVMQACGINERADTILSRVRSVASATAANYSSMHQDIARKRLTEIDAISGYLIAQADKNSIPVPNHKALYKQILAISGNLPTHYRQACR